MNYDNLRKNLAFGFSNVEGFTGNNKPFFQELIEKLKEDTNDDMLNENYT